MLEDLVAEDWRAGWVSGRASLRAQAGSRLGSCLAWALTAPFLALMRTPCSVGLGAADC